MKLKNKVIAIIGSTGILGTEYVRFLSSQGANVVIGDVNIEKCNKLSQEVKLNYKTDPLAIKIDLYSEKSIIQFYKNILKKYNVIHSVINNSQVKPDGFYNSFQNYSKKTLMRVIEGNTVGITISCQQAIKIFLKQGFGTIVNVASIYGILGADQRIYQNVKNIYNEEKFTSPVSYAISKASLINLSKYLASYYRESNIRINSITLGGVYDNHDNNFVKNYSSKTLLGRMAHKKEYNEAILFLVTDASSYMTGSNLIIDGGWSAI